MAYLRTHGKHAVSNREAVYNRAEGLWAAPSPRTGVDSLLPDFIDLQYRWLLDIFQPGRILCAFFMFKGWKYRCMPLLMCGAWDQLSYELKELMTS